MKLKLTALSPIHIGSGKEYDPFDFYFEGDRVLILNNEKCMDALYEDDPANIEVYIKWVNNTTEKITRSEDEVEQARRNRDKSRVRDKNQLIADLRKNFNIIDFCENELKNSQLAGRLKTGNQYHHYQAYCPSRPRSVLKLKQAIKTGSNLYIPGSSIKGLLRTALAYKAIKELSKEQTADFLKKQDRNSKSILEILKEIKQASQNAVQAMQSGNRREYEMSLKKANKLRKRFEKRIGDEAEKFLFGCDDGSGKLDDAKFDIMRLIKVSDTQKAQFSVLIQEMKSFTPNRRDQNMKSNPISLTEFIDTESEFEFDIKIESELIKELNERKGKKDWGGFVEKFERLFGLSVYELCALDNSDLEKKIVEKILQAVKEFGGAIRDKEKNWLQQFQSEDKRELEGFLNGLPNNKASAKIGFASGWFATTVGLAFAQNDYLKELLSDILYAFNLDLIIKDQKIIRRTNFHERDRDRQLRLLQRKPDTDAFPKSRRLTAERRSASEYIGWVAIDKDRIKSPDKKNTGDNEINQKSPESDDIQSKLKALKEKFNN